MRQLSITDTIFGNENQTCVFTYDEFSRVTKDSCGSAWGAAYAYDLFGNMAKSTIAGSPGTSFQPTYNISNHFATLPSGTPSYDSNGNLLNDSFHPYTWDIESNPVAVDGNPITYDALNRRVEYYNSGVGYVQYLWAPYDATRNLLIESSSGAQVQLPLPGGGQAMVGPSGVTNYRRPNWQGSQVIDSTPSQTADVDAAFTPYGEHYDENNYLGFFGGNLSIYPFFMDGYAATWRLYHYDQGRWISPDPAGLSAVDPSNPQTWNRYAYVAGNPLNNTDPSGLDDDGSPAAPSPQTPDPTFSVDVWGYPFFGPGIFYRLPFLFGGIDFAPPAARKRASTPSNAQIKRDALDQMNLRSCSSQVFGNANALTSTNAPAIRYLSPSQLQAMGHSGDAAGTNDPRTNTAFFNSSVFTGNLPYIYYQSNYLHEAGNIISARLFGGNEYARGNMFVGATEYPIDPDSGASYERCIFGGRMQIP
jgi:RHS repeat-associated protein